MKLINIFAIGGAVVLPVGIYLSQAVETKWDTAQKDNGSLSVYEKPMLDGISSNSNKEDLKETLTILVKEVAQLKAEILDLRTDLQAQKVKLNATNKAPMQEKAQDVQALIEAHAKEDARIGEDKQKKEQGEALETGFRQQTEDPKWSAKAKNLVQDALTTDNVATKSIVNIECRSSMCRLELTGDANNQGLDIAELPMKVGQELPNIMANNIKESDGSTTTVLYLSKNKFDLPKQGN